MVKRKTQRKKRRQRKKRTRRDDYGGAPNNASTEVFPSNAEIIKLIEASTEVFPSNAEIIKLIEKKFSPILKKYRVEATDFKKIITIAKCEVNALYDDVVPQKSCGDIHEAVTEIMEAQPNGGGGRKIKRKGRKTRRKKGGDLFPDMPLGEDAEAMRVFLYTIVYFVLFTLLIALLMRRGILPGAKIN